MATADTKELIQTAVARFVADVPALAKVALVVRLELRARGEAAVWRLEMPGPTVKRDPAGDARVAVSVPRPRFNELATKGHLRDWVAAHERGQVSVTGDQTALKLLGRVIERRMARR